MNLPFDEIIKHCQIKFPEEACGIVIEAEGKNMWVPCENVSIGDKTNTFAIHPLDFARASDKGEVVAVVHSHTDGTQGFSPTDIAMQKRQGIPWVLINLSTEVVEVDWLMNKKEDVPLYDRTYVWHVTDCFSFIRDWYSQEMNIYIPDFQREEKFWEKGQELYLDHFAEADFVEVPREDIQYGDCLLLQIAGKITSHAAVYVGNNKMAHHLNGKLSSIDVYGQYYQNRTTKVVRHRSKLNDDSRSNN